MGKQERPVGTPVAVPMRGSGGLTEGGRNEGGRSRGTQRTFWRENKQNSVMDWMWRMNEKGVPKMTPRSLT